MPETIPQNRISANITQSKMPTLLEFQTPMKTCFLIQYICNKERKTNDMQEFKVQLQKLKLGRHAGFERKTRTYQCVVGIVIIPPVDETRKNAFSCHYVDKHGVHADPFQWQDQVPEIQDINLAWQYVKLSLDVSRLNKRRRYSSRFSHE